MKLSFLSLLMLLGLFLKAQDDIPLTEGWSGFALMAPGYYNIASNRIVIGPPLNNDVGNFLINSLTEEPQEKSSVAFALAGEVNYTFAKSRTQLHLGNRLEDVLRLDVPYLFGVRQELKDSSILALAAVLTPLPLKYWEDPYVINQERVKTRLNFSGLRLRWGSMFKTGLELTGTMRWYNFDNERSGAFLVANNQLRADEQSLLIRNGKVIRLQAIYRIEKGPHRFEPTIRYINDDHDGDAVANSGYTAKLTYLYLKRRIIIDANVAFGSRRTKAEHPVYNSRVNSDRIGGALTIIMPLKKFKTSFMGLLLIGQYYEEDASVDFFNTSVNSVLLGVFWRHLKQ